LPLSQTVPASPAALQSLVPAQMTQWWLALQISPAQSAFCEQSPATHEPLTHTTPLAMQSAFCAQLGQTLAAQIFPVAQDTSAAQSPPTHLPPSQTWPEPGKPHCPLLLHALQAWPRQASPAFAPVQSAWVTQLPAAQAPLSQTKSALLPRAHCGPL